MAVNKCIKYLVFIFNFLFWISGCIILGVSIYLKVAKNKNKIFDDGVPFVDLLIAVGVIIMVLGFLGCCGAIRENRCLLMLFFVGLLLIFILLLVAGILGAVGESKAKEYVKERLGEWLPLSGQDADIQNDLQEIEEEAKCCGLINGPEDWGSNVPTSCDCLDEAKTCKAIAGGRRVYSTPCVEIVTSFIEKNALIALGIAFGIAALMVFGMAFAMTLYCQIGKKDGPTTA